MTEEIAKIRAARLGWEGHGILSVSLDLDYGGTTQSAGGYALDEPVRDAAGAFKGRRGTGYGCEFICRVMRACGVDEWGDVQGRTVIAVRDDGWNGRVIGIRPLPTEPGEPFMFATLADEFKARQP